MPTPNDLDAELLAMIQRHDLLWDEWNAVADEDDESLRIETLARECCDLELRIVTTPAQTAAGLAGKRRVIGKTGFTGDEAGNPPTGDVVELVEAILAIDAERIAG